MLLIELTNEKPNLYLLVGLPGTGKSTYIKDVLSKTLKNYVVVSSDDVLERIATEKNKTYDDIFLDNIDAATQESNSIFEKALKNNLSIVVDKTNLSIKSRKKWLQRCGDRYNKIAVIFEVDDHTICNRLEQRSKQSGKTIRPQIFIDMKKRYQPPSLGEGFDQIIKVD